MEGRLPAGCGSGGFVLSPGGRKDRSRPPCKRVILNRRDLIEEERTQQSDHVCAAVADDAALAAAHSILADESATKTTPRSRPPMSWSPAST